MRIQPLIEGSFHEEIQNCVTYLSQNHTQMWLISCQRHLECPCHIVCMVKPLCFLFAYKRNRKPIYSDFLQIRFCCLIGCFVLSGPFVSSLRCSLALLSDFCGSNFLCQAAMLLSNWLVSAWLCFVRFFALWGYKFLFEQQVLVGSCTVCFTLTNLQVMRVSCESLRLETACQ